MPVSQGTPAKMGEHSLSALLLVRKDFLGSYGLSFVQKSTPDGLDLEGCPSKTYDFVLDKISQENN